MRDKDFLIRKYFSPKNLEEALKIQEILRRRVKIRALERKVEKIVGFDASFKEEIIRAGVCVINFPQAQVLEEKVLERKISFPYIPGLFAFREGPIIIELFYSLRIKPDLIILEAQGIAHPRALGLASQVGVVLNIASMGISKNILYGFYKEPGKKRGDFSFIYHPQTKEKIGLVFRTKDKTKPLFISPGNLLNLRDCLRLIRRISGNYRLPDILRRVHRLSSF